MCCLSVKKTGPQRSKLGPRTPLAHFLALTTRLLGKVSPYAHQRVAVRGFSSAKDLGPCTKFMCIPEGTDLQQ